MLANQEPHFDSKGKVHKLGAIRRVKDHKDSINNIFVPEVK